MALVARGLIALDPDVRHAFPDALPRISPRIVAFVRSQNVAASPCQRSSAGGAIVARADVYDVVPMPGSSVQHDQKIWAHGPWLWLLRDVTAIEPTHSAVSSASLTSVDYVSDFVAYDVVAVAYSDRFIVSTSSRSRATSGARRVSVAPVS